MRQGVGMAEKARVLVPPALEAFSERVHNLPADRWDAPTPCAQWSVRELVKHLTSEHLWAPHLLRGETMADVGDRYDGDVLGDDPASTWGAAAAASKTAWQDASDDQVVHLSFGDAPASEYAEQMLLDLTVHGWDLVQGAGLDMDMDPEATEHVLAYVRSRADELAGTGLFDAPVDVGSSDPADQLLGLLGRRP